MRFGLKSAVVGIAAVAVLMASGGTASAKLTDLALGTDEAKVAGKCVAAISKNLNKYAAAYMKLIIKCKAGVIKGKGGSLGACAGPLPADLQAKDDGNFGKLVSGIAGKCCGKDKTCGAGVGDEADIPLANINWDIGTCRDFEGAGGGAAITTADDISTCLRDQIRDASHQIANTFGADIFDSGIFGAGADPGKTNNKCQDAAFKTITKFYLGKAKTIGKCWASKVKRKGDDFDDAIQCPDTDSIKNKTGPAIEKQEKKLAAALCKKCGGVADKDKNGLCDDGVSFPDPASEALPITGFITAPFACEPVTIPGSSVTHFYDNDGSIANGVDCGAMGDSHGAPGVVDTIQEYVNCVTCIAEYKADCLAHQFNGENSDHGMVYPAECLGSLCGNGVVDGGETCDPAAASPQCPGGNGNQDCTSTCECLCPATVTFEPDPNDPASVLSTGFSGFAHGSSVIGFGTVTVGLSGGDEGAAGERDPTCGIMDIAGPLQNPDAGAGQIDVIRCSVSSEITCDADSDCPGETCVTYFGSRLPLSAGGVSACVTNRFTAPIVGTADIETGESANTVSIESEVKLGISTGQPCEVCLGDLVVNDGSQDGTCDSGANAGGACDVGGVSPQPAFNGSPTGDPNGFCTAAATPAPCCTGLGTGTCINGTSLDCPAPGATVLPINLSNSTGVEALTVSATGPSCGAAGFTSLTCMCDTCATAAAEPCNEDADCPGGASGSCGGLRCTTGGSQGATCTLAGSVADPDCHAHCTGAGVPDACCTGLGTGFFCSACTVPGEPTKPNPCVSGLCTAGECTDFSPGYCGPQETFRGCLAASDCPFPGDSCAAVDQPCFDDDGVVGATISATGAADVPVNDDSSPTLASVFCVAPVAEAAINTATGLPGAGRVTLTGAAQGLP